MNVASEMNVAAAMNTVMNTVARAMNVAES
jgi:hypothetical protein